MGPDLSRAWRGIDRRTALLGAASALVLPRRAAAAEDNGSAFPLRDDSDRPVANFRIPAELDPEALPGVTRIGPADAEAFLFEFFDYNCPWCRAAAGEIEALGTGESAARVGFVNNPILSPESVEAARIQQAVLRTSGPEVALAFHRALLARRGRANAEAALDVATGIGLRRDEVERAAAGETVARVLERQTKLAAGLGLVATPSFVINGFAVLGWPGPRSMRRAVVAIQKCEKLVCVSP